MNQTIKLDTRKREGKYGEARIAPLRQGERNNAMLTVKICANGQPYDLAGKTASLVATTAAGKLVGPCPMEVAEAGIARIMLPAALYSAVGSFSGYVEIREGETLVDTTDSFGGKVIECADLDSEQAAEFTPLLGELQNAVAQEVKRVEAEKARVQAETERATGFAEAKQASQAATKAANDAAEGANLAASSASAATESANTAAGKATNAAAKAESDVRAFVNAAGTAVGDAIAGAKDDVDAAVKRSDAATAKAEAAVKTADAANTAATKAVTDARDAIAEVKATEAKLYPAADNILVGSETGEVAHVEDAFAGASLRKIMVEGACRQDVTTGKNLVDAYNKDNESGYLTVDGALKADSSYVYHVSDYVPIEPNTTYFVTMSRTTNTSAPAVCEYDSGKAFVAGHNRLAKGAAFTTASNTAFVRVSCKTDEPGVIQLEKGSTQTAYEPYSGGKPSPSPEWPQQITIVENPIMKVVGRNLVDVPSTTVVANQLSGNIVGCELIPKDETAYLSFVSSSESVSAARDSAAWSLIDKDGNVRWSVKPADIAKGINRSELKPPFDAVRHQMIPCYRKPTTAFEMSDYQLELGGYHDYKPYTEQSIAFTLPEEHPYLAKLQDGTADEIVVDEAGNVELVARVSKAIIDASQLLDWGKGKALYDFPKDGRYYPQGGYNGTSVVCEKLEAKNGSDIYRGDEVGISVGSSAAHIQNCTTVLRLGDGVDTSSIDGASFYYPLMTETRHPLGKIELPKAQDSIVNAWTDAEVTPNTSIGYVRDVNIVVANLESAIASITEG